jgi:hypothetical protein
MRLRLAGQPERGSVTVFVAIASIGLLVMIGLVVDGGTKVRAIQQADRLAAEAARAAGQAIDVPAAVVGEVPVVQPAVAVAAAAAFLATAGVQGSVSLLDGGRRVAVTTSVEEDTVFLGLIGIHRLQATGRAEAQLVRGVTGAEP